MRPNPQEVFSNPEVFMHLLRQTALVGIIVAGIGCHDVSGPPGLPANYLLTSINGRPLPTFLSPIPESPTVNYSTLFLDGSGNAIRIENQRVMISPGEVTYTTNYTYTISGNTIQFHILCPQDALALCAKPPVGTFVNSHLLLDLSGGSNQIVYDYQLAAQD